MNLEWMAWTVPTAIFFTMIGLCLIAMTVWQIVSPSFPRQGFLPIETTRGDRFFITLLTAAFIMVGWLAATEATLWIALILSAAVGALIMRYG